MGTTALVVDDDLGMCELIQAILGSVDIAAEILTDSAKAAAHLQQKKFDAIFLDVNMPAPDGIELARQIRATGFNQKTLIIMITGEEDRGLLARGFAAGANFFLFKPVDRESAGFHPFRRFRESILQRSEARTLLIDYWMGHANGEMSGRYGKQLLENVVWRQECAAKVGLGFSLSALTEQPQVVGQVVGQVGQVLRVAEHHAIAI